MHFNPNNAIIQLCMQGMTMEEKGESEKAGQLFLQAWSNASDSFEKFIAAYYLARHQNNVADKLSWLRISAQLADTLDSPAAKGALPSIYSDIAKCYRDMGEAENVSRYEQLAHSSATIPTDSGPFYHGTKADVNIGGFLTAGFHSNYKEELLMNHIYFTALLNGAGLAAELARGDAPARVYVVEPVGDFENDPNVTNKRFPGNPTRSYRTASSLKVLGEVTEWTKLTREELQKWRDRLANNSGEIIN